MNISRNEMTLRLCAAIATLLICAPAHAGENPANYAPGQAPVGEPAIFHTSGPATQNPTNNKMDGMLDAVEYSNGRKYIFFYEVVDVFDLQYTGDPDLYMVGGCSGVTIGKVGFLEWGDADGDQSDVTPADIDAFREGIVRVLSNRNLNNYIDVAAPDLEFSFVIEFDMMVRDNDPDPDDLGELLLFERGIHDGNSWITLQAVDSSGVGLAPALLISPHETSATTPRTYIKDTTQQMGGTAIDVSRLGVTEFKYLRVSTTETGDPQFAYGGDRNPDFKLMAVMTDQVQISLTRTID
jgi:hypothetical protein